MEKIPTLTQITSIPKRFDKSEYFVLNNINMTLIIKWSVCKLKTMMTSGNTKRIYSEKKYYYVIFLTICISNSVFVLMTIDMQKIE